MVVVWQWFKLVYYSRAVGSQSSALSSVAVTRLHSTSPESLGHSTFCRFP